MIARSKPSAEHEARRECDEVASWRADECVIGVDRDDNEIGLVSRRVAHGIDGGLHRAFMIFLVNEAGELLLCRRSSNKRLWPGVWADSCAGHPRPGEAVQRAAGRRLNEELGCTPALRRIGSFVYRACYGDTGCENELCHVFVGRLGAVKPNPAEVQEVGLFGLTALKQQILERPDEFAPWVGECLQHFPDSAFWA